VTTEDIVRIVAGGRLAFSVPEAAVKLGWKKSKAYELIKKGEIRVVDIGGQMRDPEILA